MLGKIRRHIAQQYMGFIALIIALSGTAYAVATVGSGDVIDDSLRSRDIKNGTLTSADVRDHNVEGGGLESADLRDASVTGAKLGNRIIYSDAVLVPPSGGVGQVEVFCPTGTRLISGGAAFSYPSGDISASWPAGGGWLAEGQNNGNQAQYLSVWAICMP